MLDNPLHWAAAMYSPRSRQARSIAPTDLDTLADLTSIDWRVVRMQSKAIAGTDGVTWRTNIADGYFVGIQKKPGLQEVTFAPASVRHSRLSFLHALWGSARARAAEGSVRAAGGGQPLAGAI